MQQRYYDPAIGRFLSVDPVASDTTTGWNFNRYNYAANNPYKFTDPDGRSIQCDGQNCHINCTLGPECLIDGIAYVLINHPSTSAAMQVINQYSESEEATDDAEGSDSSDEKKKAKDRRREQQEAAREEKFGERGEPASEEYVKWKAKEKEKRDGKEGRRQSHDEKEKGEPDRSKERIDDDYQ